MRLTTIILFCLSPSLFAGIYAWQDEEGRTHFGDHPPLDSQAEELKLQINTYTSPEIKPLTGSTRVNRTQSIVMYSTEWCGVCKNAKRYFKKNKIAFQEYDVEKSAKGKRDFKRLQGRGVPIILVGDQRMHGFSPARFETIYQER